MIGDLDMLGREGDVLDFLACAHGVTISLALSIGRRLVAYGGGRHVQRQGRALAQLSRALAAVFRDGTNAIDEATAVQLIALMQRADRAEKRGLRHNSLVGMPAKWPFKRLSIDPPRLALCGAMRLRAALEERQIAGGAAVGTAARRQEPRSRDYRGGPPAR